jgi:hypothetical protein
MQVVRHVSAAAIALLLLAWLLLTPSAQAQGSRQLELGQKIRMRTCTPACGWRHEGILVGWASDTVAIQTNYAVVKLAQTHVRAIDVEVPNRAFKDNDAVLGAVLGGAAALAAAHASGVKTGSEEQVMIPAALTGAFLGALAGGSASARRSARTGLIVGAVPGALAGLIWCSIAEGFASCDVEDGAGVGALFGAGVGATLGVVFGALDRNHWERLSPGRIEVTPVFTFGGSYGLVARLCF